MDLNDWPTRYYESSLKKTADRLRDLADQIEHVGKVVDRESGPVDVATDVVHDVLSALTNLRLDVLVRAARDLEVERAKVPSAS